MDLFRKFLNRLGRTYGQADKALFGGVLPGGADSRFISAPQNPLSPAAVVRSAPFQTARDFLLEKSGLPKPEQFYIKGMTGGSRDITTMTPEELALIKGSYDKKYNTKPLSAEKMLNMAKMHQGPYASFVEVAKKKYAAASQETKNSPFGQAMLNAINTPFDINKALESVKIANKMKKDYVKNSGPVVSLYGQGRDMKMAYGNLSVYPQPGGGVQIYDRWKVDEANQVIPGINKKGIRDQPDSVLDLGEGGPIPSLIYNAAKSLGTYEPFDIRVNVSPQEWQNVQGKINNPTSSNAKMDMNTVNRDEQGFLLNQINNLYSKIKQKITPSPQLFDEKPTPLTFTTLLKDSLD
jgi:hypothetical protein